MHIRLGLKVRSMSLLKLEGALKGRLISGLIFPSLNPLCFAVFSYEYTLSSAEGLFIGDLIQY